MWLRQMLPPKETELQSMFIKCQCASRSFLQAWTVFTLTELLFTSNGKLASFLYPALHKVTDWILHSNSNSRLASDVTFKEEHISHISHLLPAERELVSVIARDIYEFLGDIAPKLEIQSYRSLVYPLSHKIWLH